MRASRGLEMNFCQRNVSSSIYGEHSPLRLASNEGNFYFPLTILVCVKLPQFSPFSAQTIVQSEILKAGAVRHNTSMDWARMQSIEQIKEILFGLMGRAHSVFPKHCTFSQYKRGGRNVDHNAQSGGRLIHSFPHPSDELCDYANGF